MLGKGPNASVSHITVNFSCNTECRHLPYYVTDLFVRSYVMQEISAMQYRLMEFHAELELKLNNGLQPFRWHSTDDNSLNLSAQSLGQ